MTPRAVFDCMVFLQAAVREAGPAAACLRAVERELVDLTIDEAGWAELVDVLNRPAVRARFSAMTEELVDQFLSRLRQLAHVVPAAPAAFPFDRDPKDAKYLDLALEIGAEFLVTRDNELLALMTADDASATAWRHRAPRVRIVDPVEFLRALRLAYEST